MEVKKASPSAPAIKWAVINLVTSIIITYGIQFTNADPNSAIKYLGLLPFIGFLLLTQKEYRDQLGGFMTFGEGFLSGFLYAVFTGILSAVFIYLYYAILSPQMVEKTIASTQAQLEAKGMSQDQIDTALNITRKYFAIIGSVAAVFSAAFFGAIVALIGAAIFKKERSPFDVPGYNDDEPKTLDPTV
jgi:hypothetical protein